MTCCCVDTINNRRLFSLRKEQRRAIENISGGRANFFLCHAIYQYYAAIDVLSTPGLYNLEDFIRRKVSPLFLVHMRRVNM